MDHAYGWELPLRELPDRAPVYDILSRSFSNGSVVPSASWILQVSSQDP